MPADPRYNELLDVDPSIEAPTYFDLLLLPFGESDKDKIKAGFKSQMKKLQKAKGSKHKGFVEYLKEELRKAQATLTNDKKREKYIAEVKEKRFESLKNDVSNILAFMKTVPADAYKGFIATGKNHGMTEEEADEALKTIFEEAGATVQAEDSSPSSSPSVSAEPKTDNPPAEEPGIQPGIQPGSDPNLKHDSSGRNPVVRPAPGRRDPRLAPPARPRVSDRHRIPTPGRPVAPPTGQNPVPMMRRPGPGQPLAPPITGHTPGMPPPGMSPPTGVAPPGVAPPSYGGLQPPSTQPMSPVGSSSSPYGSGTLPPPNMGGPAGTMPSGPAYGAQNYGSPYGQPAGYGQPSPYGQPGPQGSPVGPPMGPPMGQAPRQFPNPYGQPTPPPPGPGMAPGAGPGVGPGMGGPNPYGNRPPNTNVSDRLPMPGRGPGGGPNTLPPPNIGRPGAPAPGTTGRSTTKFSDYFDSGGGPNGQPSARNTPKMPAPPRKTSALPPHLSNDPEYKRRLREVVDNYNMGARSVKIAYTAHKELGNFFPANRPNEIRYTINGIEYQQLFKVETKMYKEAKRAFENASRLLKQYRVREGLPGNFSAIMETGINLMGEYMKKCKNLKLKTMGTLPRHEEVRIWNDFLREPRQKSYSDTIDIVE